MRSNFRHPLLPAIAVVLLIAAFSADAVAQKKRTSIKPRPASRQSELETLRKQYVETTKEYKASLERLLALYKAAVRKAEDRHDKSKDLFKEGLISKKQLDESEQAITAEELKVTGVQQQLKDAETVIAQTLL